MARILWSIWDVDEGLWYIDNTLLEEEAIDYVSSKPYKYKDKSKAIKKARYLNRFEDKFEVRKHD
jgi:hypothetical protein